MRQEKRRERKTVRPNKLAVTWNVVGEELHRLNIESSKLAKSAPAMLGDVCRDVCLAEISSTFEEV